MFKLGMHTSRCGSSRENWRIADLDPNRVFALKKTTTNHSRKNRVKPQKELNTIHISHNFTVTIIREGRNQPSQVYSVSFLRQKEPIVVDITLNDYDDVQIKLTFLKIHFYTKVFSASETWGCKIYHFDTRMSVE